MQIDRDKYIQAWDPELRSQSGQYRSGPVEDRPCRDLFCLLLFILISVSFIWFGIHYLRTGRAVGTSNPAATITPAPGTHPSAHANYQWKPALTIIMLMAVATIVLSAVYLFLIKKFPKCMIYFTMAVGALLFIALAVIAFVSGQWILGLFIILVLAIITICMWCCLRNSMEATVLVLRLTACFLQNNLSIFLVPVVVALFSFLLLSFGVAWSLQAISTIEGPITSQQRGLFVLQLIYYLFFNFFMYYVLVFLIASAVGYWYYQKEGGCCVGLKHLVGSHIGSLTFASIIIGFIKFIQFALETAQRESTNICTSICLCCVQCCIGMIEGLVQMMNHYAVIVMSYTGQGFVDSAKAAGVVIFSHPELFAVLSSASGFLVLSGLLFLTILPTAASVLICKAMAMSEAAPAVGIFTFFVSLVIAIFFLCTLSETISAMFVFHCFDRQLQVYGVRELPLPGGQLYSYEQLVNQDLFAVNPGTVLSAAYPYVSGQAAPQATVHPSVVPSYSPVAAEPAQLFPSVAPKPLYQPYNSGIKSNYENRDYNAPGYMPSSGLGPDYQNRAYNDPARFSASNPTTAPNRPQGGNYPQL